MKVTAHTDMCIAAGNCGAVAPHVFRNSRENDGFVELLDPHPPESEWENVRDAEMECPSGAIQVED